MAHTENISTIFSLQFCCKSKTNISWQSIHIYAIYILYMNIYLSIYVYMYTHSYIYLHLSAHSFNDTLCWLIETRVLHLSALLVHDKHLYKTATTLLTIYKYIHTYKYIRCRNRIYMTIKSRSCN